MIATGVIDEPECAMGGADRHIGELVEASLRMARDRERRPTVHVDVQYLLKAEGVKGTGQ